MEGENERRLHEALRAASDPQDVVSLVRREPAVLSDEFQVLLESWIARAEAEGNHAAALGLRQRQSVLQEIRRSQEREAALPALGRALMAFIRAEDEEAAGQVYAREREVLATDEAQRALERSFRSEDMNGQARIVERARLLRELRESHRT